MKGNSVSICIIYRTNHICWTDTAMGYFWNSVIVSLNAPHPVHLMFPRSMQAIDWHDVQLKASTNIYILVTLNTLSLHLNNKSPFFFPSLPKLDIGCKMEWNRVNTKWILIIAKQLCLLILLPITLERTFRYVQVLTFGFCSHHFSHTMFLFKSLKRNNL